VTNITLEKPETSDEFNDRLLQLYVISAGNDWNYFSITGGGVGGNFNTVDNSNHPSRQIITSGSNSGIKPMGANIAFADGHVGWRPFEEMKFRVQKGPWFWW